MGLPHDAEAMHTEIVLRELVSAVKDLKQIVYDSHKTGSDPDKYRETMQTFYNIDYGMKTAEKALVALKERRVGTPLTNKSS